MAKIYDTLAALVADVDEDSTDVANRVNYRGKSYLVLAEDETDALACVFVEQFGAEAGLVPMAELIAAARVSALAPEKPEASEKPASETPASETPASETPASKTSASKTLASKTAKKTTASKSPAKK